MCEVFVCRNDAGAHRADVAWLDLEQADIGVRGWGSRVIVWGERQPGCEEFDCDEVDLAPNGGLADGVYPLTTTPGLYAVHHPMQSRALEVFKRRFPDIDPAYPELAV